MTARIVPNELYRMPWSLNENVLAWLEPTKRCNLYCEGCYSRNDPQSDKTLAQVRSDIEVIVSQRQVDSISIAGGDPLVHPDIVEIVRMIRHDFDLKPVINTNGLALNPQFLHDLKEAGLHGVTFHVDSSQHRPYHKGKNELELCDLRLQLAQMVADEGGLSVAFNATIFRDTVPYVPALMEWAADHIDIVHSMVFILFRTARSEQYKYFAQGKTVKTDDLVYYDQDKNNKPLTAHELIEVIQANDPDYRPAAFLGGTEDPNSFKWLLAGRIGSPGKIAGYVGPKTMEVVQTTHHWATGRYLAYSDPSMLGHGRSMALGMSALDPQSRRTAGRMLLDPRRLANRHYFQSVLVIQPIDMMPDGRMNMCDGCPDMTVHNGELVWSCRLDERVQHGCFLTAAPKPAPKKKATPKTKTKTKTKAKAKTQPTAEAK